MIKPLLVLFLSTAYATLGPHAEDQVVTSISPDPLAINGAEATHGLTHQWVNPKPNIEPVVIALHGRLRNE
ncbi:alpha/beta hydrolase, partial [Pseudomonas syringae pv. tagetis]